MENKNKIIISYCLLFLILFAIYFFEMKDLTTINNEISYRNYLSQQQHKINIDINNISQINNITANNIPEKFQLNKFTIIFSCIAIIIFLNLIFYISQEYREKKLKKISIVKNNSDIEKNSYIN